MQSGLLSPACRVTGLQKDSALETVGKHGRCPNEKKQQTAFSWHGHSYSRCKRSHAYIFLLLRSGADFRSLGQGVILLGILLLLLPQGKEIALFGLVLIGLGCAPIYPSIIHSTPEHFGAEKSQAMIGVQMASAYAGTCLMPPLFGLIANHNRFTFAFLFTVNPGSHGMDA